MIFARYILLVHGPVDVDDRPLESSVRQQLPELLREVEENLSLLLPREFHVTIEVKEEE